MNIILAEESHTQAEYIHLRFRTMRSNCLILTTASNDKSMSHLTISLESSRVKISINFGEGIKIVQIGHSLNDDQWHSIKIERRGPSIEVKLDKETQMTEITGQLITLHIASIHVGAYVHDIKSQHSTSELQITELFYNSDLNDAIPQIGSDGNEIYRIFFRKAQSFASSRLQ